MHLTNVAQLVLLAEVGGIDACLRKHVRLVQSDPSVFCLSVQPLLAPATAGDGNMIDRDESRAVEDVIRAFRRRRTGEAYCVMVWIT
jgi:hypothetical protein